MDRLETPLQPPEAQETSDAPENFLKRPLTYTPLNLKAAELSQYSLYSIPPLCSNPHARQCPPKSETVR